MDNYGNEIGQKMRVSRKVKKQGKINLKKKHEPKKLSRSIMHAFCFYFLVNVFYIIFIS